MNGVLDFGGHFLSLGSGSFFKRRGFSTATLFLTSDGTLVSETLEPCPQAPRIPVKPFSLPGTISPYRSIGGLLAKYFVDALSGQNPGRERFDDPVRRRWVEHRGGIPDQEVPTACALTHQAPGYVRSSGTSDLTQLAKFCRYYSGIGSQSLISNRHPLIQIWSNPGNPFPTLASDCE